MQLEFWSDVDGQILTVRFVRAFGFERVRVDLEGAPIEAVKTEIRRGNSYAFEAGGKRYVVHSIVSRGVRYVSLYEDETLVREYCCAYERAKSAYDANPAVYDSTAAFVKAALWVDAIVAGFMLSMTLLICGLKFDVFHSVISVVLLSVAVFILSYAAVFGLHAAGHFMRRAQMTKQGITQPRFKTRIAPRKKR